MEKKENVRAALDKKYPCSAADATIHRQNFTFKDGLGGHHRLQIDNDLRSALESEN